MEAELKDYEVVNAGSGSGSKKGKGSKKKKSGSKKFNVPQEPEADDDELPTISNLRTRSTNNDWEEEYADLIEDTDDLK